MAKIKKTKINVKQSNELTESAYYLSLKAKRVLWLCLMQTYLTDYKQSVIEEDDEYESSFKVKVDDYHELFGVNRVQASKDVREGVLELSRSSVVFYPKEGEYARGIVARPWLTEAGSKDVRGSWVIDFNPKLLKYIYGLSEQFTTYSLRDCGSLKNPRTIRLYESLCQFRSSGTWLTSRQWLNDRFMLPDSQKNNLAEMKRTFLDPALKLITEKTPLNVAYSIDSEEKIIFTIVPKSAA
jgi:plasmid replication initiation protein